MKKLAVADPIFACMPMDANIQAILLPHAEMKSWILSQFISLWACDDVQEDFFVYFVNPDYWFGCPYLFTEELHKSLIFGSSCSKIDFVKNCIDHDTYIIPTVDTFYIPAYHSNIHSFHECLIYGYDDEKELLYIADFCPSYSFTTCTYAEFERASYEHKNYFDWSNVVRFAKYDAKREHPKFEICLSTNLDFSVMLNLLYDYRDGINSQLRYHIKQEFGDYFSFRYGGLRIYEKFREHLVKCFNQEIKIRIKVFYLLKAHKLIMKERLEYLESVCEIDFSIPLSNCIKLLQDVDLLLSLILRYNISFKGQERILKLLKNISLLDKQLTEDIIRILEKNRSKNPIFMLEHDYIARSYEPNI